MPSGWAAAVALYGSSLSQGKTGRREETALTKGAHFLVRTVLCDGRAGKHRGPAGQLSRTGTGEARSAVLRRQRCDEGVVPLDQAELGGATGRAELVEELDVRLVVVLPLV